MNYYTVIVSPNNNLKRNIKKSVLNSFFSKELNDDEIKLCSKYIRELCFCYSSHPYPTGNISLRIPYNFYINNILKLENLRSITINKKIKNIDFYENLKKIKNLKEINIFFKISNSKYKYIIESIALCKNIKYLELRINYFPEELTKMKYLKHIHLENSNDKIDKLPIDICNLEYLHTMYFNTSVNYLIKDNTIVILNPKSNINFKTVSPCIDNIKIIDNYCGTEYFNNFPKSTKNITITAHFDIKNNNKCNLPPCIESINIIKNEHLSLEKIKIKKLPYGAMLNIKKLNNSLY